MSDEDKDKPEGDDGFTPAPPPPQLSEEEAGMASAAEATADLGEHTDGTALPEGSVHVPQDTAKRALEAVQILVENNRSASQQLESLMSIVLDAAEVANRSASHVTRRKKPKSLRSPKKQKLPRRQMPRPQKRKQRPPKHAPKPPKLKLRALKLPTRHYCSNWLVLMRCSRNNRSPSKTSTVRSAT